MILALYSSKAITFFPLVDSLQQACTSTFLFSKSIRLSGKGF
jgi:hypothetical protein